MAASKTPMRRLFLVCVFLAACSAARAQSLLPTSLGDWRDAGAAAVVPARTEQTPVLVEYGLTRTERRAYSREAAALNLTLYQFRDPTGAYGAFTYLREPAMASTDLAEYSAVSHGAALILTGNLLLHAQAGAVADARPDLKSLAIELSRHADGAPYPELERYLPAGRIAGSERFILGPLALKDFVPSLPAGWAGFDASAEVQGARYSSTRITSGQLLSDVQGFRTDSGTQTLLLVAYPTHLTAAKHLDGLRRWFNVNGDENVVEGRPVVFVRRSRSLLILATGEPREAAQALAERVELRSEVTWNEPTHTLTDRPWGETVYGIFVGTGYIMLFALISGVVFGGFRLLVKKLLPGKVFDRGDSVEIIQLGISSKPIEGKDFY